MRRHVRYLRYLARHKYFVLVAGLKLKAPLWRLIIHDWTKFLPNEWFGYLNHFYPKKNQGPRLSSDLARMLDQPDYEGAFQKAWLHHIHWNKHHWQHYYLIEDPGGFNQPLDMPDRYVREMVADWQGAGRAITGRWRAQEWYEERKDKIVLSDRTRRRVELLLQIPINVDHQSQPVS